ncbi:uncharacterized protein LOC127034043 isoform X2 [Gopherus flavomarginatus]|uniref:uncharacterized protein LOC127034043 isoform X2 n=1 Tax=Gopherus flavomarginatus TaxID=286002 RepID=UPI0021CBBCB5|nr:uncharacterized protein LOC127034043 isoform X2 [Gopherus flavomarginatus]
MKQRGKGVAGSLASPALSRGGCGRAGALARRERAPPAGPAPSAAWRCSACLAEGARVPLCAAPRRASHSAAHTAAAGRSGARSRRRRRAKQDAAGAGSRRWGAASPQQAQRQDKAAALTQLFPRGGMKGLEGTPQEGILKCTLGGGSICLSKVREKLYPWEFNTSLELSSKEYR